MPSVDTVGAARAFYGFRIAEVVDRDSRGVLQVGERSLYPALQRTLIKGCVTAAGRQQLRSEVEVYRSVSEAIVRILGGAS